MQEEVAREGGRSLREASLACEGGGGGGGGERDRRGK